MKHAKTFPLFVAIIASLASCNAAKPASSSIAPSSEASSTIEISSSSEVSSESSQAVTSEEFSSTSEGSSSMSEESSSQSVTLGNTNSSTSQVSVDGWNSQWNGNYTIYGVNDFHGSIVEQTNGSGYYEAGIIKYFGELQARKAADPDHTIIVSSGDMYQGSLESNYNYGHLVTEAMNAVPFDAMAIGNHEFDYGQDRLMENVALADFPILAGNIVKWDSEKGQATNTPWEKVSASTIVEKNGFKIGIVGFVGEGQTTSITSKAVADITFINSGAKAKEEALRLRNEEGCHMVICSMHAPDTEATNKWGVSTSLKDYFDAIICGHTHAKNNSTVNGVPLVQSYCNGEYVSKIVLNVNNGVITCSSQGIEAANKNWTASQDIKAIYDSYLDESFQTMANRVCGTLSGSSLNKSTVSNLACKAIYNKFVGDYPDLAFALQNSQRDGIGLGEFTYSKLYKAMPFTNNIVIVRAKGYDLNYIARKNCTFTGDTTTYATLDNNTYYTAAIIDYIAYHQDVNKRYDYIESFNKGGDGEVLAEYPNYPVDITFDYVHDDLHGKVNSADCTGKGNGFGLYA